MRGPTLQTARIPLILSVALVCWLWAAWTPIAAQEIEQWVSTPDDLVAPESAETSGPDPSYQPGWQLPSAELESRTWTQKIAGLVQGRAQLEGGYSYLHDSAYGGSQHAVPDLLLRYGLTNRLELRIGWPGYVSGTVDDGAADRHYSDTLDPNVGFVYDLWCQRGLRPQTAVLAAIPITLEGNPFALSSLQPLAELMYSWQTTEWTALTGRTGFAIFDAMGDSDTQFQQSISYDAILTDRLGVFVSWEMLANSGLKCKV